MLYITSNCHFLLQGLFVTQGSNLCLLHWQADSLPLSHQCVVGTARSDSAIPWTIAHLQAPLSMGILQARIMEWTAMPRASSRLRDRTHLMSPALATSATWETVGDLLINNRIWYSKSLMDEPLRCEHSKMQMCICMSTHVI